MTISTAKSAPVRATALASASSGELSPENLELVVLEQWRAVLNVPDLQLDDNFFELGGHSLLAARVFAQLGSQLNRKIPVSWLIETPTARALAQRLQKSAQMPASNIVPMQTQGSLPAIYFVHHLLGDVLIYRKMADCFAPVRPVFGIQASPDVSSRPRPYPLVSLAAEYVSQVLHQQPFGPFHLAGYSTGSVIAFEMARQLTAAGHQVGLLALIDGGIAQTAPPLPRPFPYWKVFVRKLFKIVFKFHDALQEGPRDFVRNRLGHVQFLWRMRTLKSDSDLTLEQALLLSEQAYRAQPYSRPALLVRFHDEARKFGPDPLMGWATVVAKGLEVIDAPGGHTTGMDSHRVCHLANILKAHMQANEISLL